MDKEYKPINLTYYNPYNSLFKSGKSDREFYNLFTCCNSENCDAYKRSKCLMLNGLWGQRCPYGKKVHKEGYTKSARKCGDLIRDIKNKYGNYEYKLKSLEFVCEIGDYVYLALPHLTNYNNSIREKDFFISEGLIKKEDFTNEFILELINYRPRALMGGVISSYQTESVPKFINQLKKYYKDKYEEVLTLDNTIEKYIENINYKDKYAKVKTLLPSKVKLSTNTLEWTGEILKAKGKDISWWDLSDEDVIIYPNENTYVKVVDNDSVTDNTEFRDE